MPTRRKSLTAADRPAIDAWNAEIGAEEAEARARRDRALEQQRAAAAKRSAELAAATAGTLKAAGLTAAAAAKRADDEFARVRKDGAAQHALARAPLAKRTKALAADMKTMVANLAAKA